MWKVGCLVLCLCLLVRSEVLPFDNTAIEKIFQEKKSALFLFTSSNDASNNAKEALKQYDEAGAPVILTVSDAEDGHGLFERLGDYLGVDTKNAPQVLYFSDKSEKFNFDQDEITKDSLASFVERVQAGSVEQFLKSAPVPANNDEPVKVVVGTTFK
jgi:protein disulfide-isomerase A1